jgi:heat shock protein HtpX
MKRTALFLATNLAILIVLGAILNITGANRFLTPQGLDIQTLLVFSAIIGFGGAFLSLLISKWIAKFTTKARVIDPQAPGNAREAWLVQTVHQFADKAKIGRPEVAIYEGPPNAFATGAFKNNALVAVSTGLMQSMTEEEVAAVLGHEVAHIANGDMVTLTLIQGVLNTFVVFFARIVGYFVDRVILKNDRGLGIGYFAAVIVSEIIFGILASIIVAWFSRQREFRADAGSARLMQTREPMIKALARLGNLTPGELPRSFEAAGISGGKGIGAWFATHPPIEQRIAALQSM